MSAAGGAEDAPDGVVSMQELKEVLKTTLRSRGVVDQVKARLRAEIYNALDDQTTPRPALSNSNLVINELIREYLEFNGYKSTLNVFMPETGQPTERPFSRDFIADQLRLPVAPGSRVPLMYSVLRTMEGGNGADRGAGGVGDVTTSMDETLGDGSTFVSDFQTSDTDRDGAGGGAALPAARTAATAGAGSGAGGGTALRETGAPSRGGAAPRATGGSVTSGDASAAERRDVTPGAIVFHG